MAIHSKSFYAERRTIMNARKLMLGIIAGLILPATVLAQRNGQPASDLLGQEDLWGNPTFIGGVTNGGPGGHSVW